MSQYRWPLSAALISYSLLGFRVPARGADVCGVIAEAAGKLWTIPFHDFARTQSGLNTTVTESIYTGGADGVIYIMMNGRWRRGPAAGDKRASDSAARQSCKYLRDEPVNGEATAVYSTHVDTRDGKVDGIIWISKSRNLLIKTESDEDVGGDGGTTHTSVRYDYADVQPPNGVE